MAKGNKKAPFDATRGSPVWAFERFTQEALSNFLRDLLHAEKDGFTAVQCDRTQVALRDLRIGATEFPDHTWFSNSIASEMERFESLYVQWNHNPAQIRSEAIAHRQKHWNKLADSRHRITTRVRRNKAKLADELDLAAMKAFYGSFDDLAKALPDIFVNLSKATASFAKKLGG
jgi:hypothetical protein